MTPRCPDCGFSMGWTRYIRCVHYGQAPRCEGCAYFAAVYRNKYGDGLDPRRSAH